MAKRKKSSRKSRKEVDSPEKDSVVTDTQSPPAPTMGEPDANETAAAAVIAPDAPLPVVKPPAATGQGARIKLQPGQIRFRMLGGSHRTKEGLKLRRGMQVIDSKRLDKIFKGKFEILEAAVDLGDGAGGIDIQYEIVSMGGQQERRYNVVNMTTGDNVNNTLLTRLEASNLLRTVGGKE